MLFGFQVADARDWTGVNRLFNEAGFVSSRKRRHKRLPIEVEIRNVGGTTGDS